MKIAGIATIVSSATKIAYRQSQRLRAFSNHRGLFSFEWNELLVRDCVLRLVFPWVVCIGIALTIECSRFEVSAQDVTFQRDVQPLLEARCLKCHGREKHEGDVDFSAILDDRAAARQRKLWRKVTAQLDAGTMPPKDETQLTSDERGRLLGWMTQAIEVVDCTDPANRDPGPALMRRLSLAEYNRTVRDLMGFECDAATAVGMIEEAGEGNPFGNMALALDVSPALMDKYFSAADQILDRFFGTELSSSIDGRIVDQARNSREQMFGLKPGEWRKVDYEVLPPPGIAPRDAARSIIKPFIRRAYRGPVTEVDVDRLLAIFDRAASQGKNYGESVRWVLKAVLVSPRFLYRVEQNRPDNDSSNSGASDKYSRVTDHELAVRLSYFLWSSMPDDELMDLANRAQLSAQGRSTEPVKFAGKVISAPGSETFQGNNRDKVFDGDLLTVLDGPDANSHWIGLDLGDAKPIRRIRYAGRIGLESRMVGGRFQASNAADFGENVTELLEVKEPPPRGWINVDLNPPVSARYIRYLPPKNSYGNIAEFEVRGFADGTVLDQQIRRMLVDPHAKSLTDNFATRWLQIHKLPTARPSTEFFPEFNANVRQAMFDETWLFFDSLRREDRSVLELLDADYTFVNEELAKYYKLPDVQGKELRRISVTPQSHRGGLLGMGSILSLTSHTSRTSPTLRGKWILDVVFGSPPPPPPANVSQIKEETQRGGDVKTFREKLAMHAQSEACAACHRKMDPLGFALDNYNAVGLWREKAGDQPLDVTGELPTGEKLNGVADLKQVILARRDEFSRNLIEQMLVYALGRELDFYDDCPVREISGQLKADNHRFSTLISEIVKSFPFQYRKNSDSH